MELPILKRAASFVGPLAVLIVWIFLSSKVEICDCLTQPVL